MRFAEPIKLTAAKIGQGGRLASEDQSVELGFDRPLSTEGALRADKLGRRSYAEAAVNTLRRVSSTVGFALSVEGAWGSGKTSTLAMMEALLRTNEPAPVVVHFNPWLVGDRDALLRHFLSKVTAEIKLTDHASAGKKVARELKAYSKVFDFIKLLPGAEPWASIFKSAIESAGDAVDSVASYKIPDIEAKKERVERALRKFGHPIIVFIDDVDRLFPLEVFEMVRIVKAVGDLPNVGYVLAWDPEYVSDALKAAGVPRSDAYLDKIIQVRLPLPAIGPEACSILINEALSRLHPDAHEAYFANTQSRLEKLYFSGLRELLEQPRDYARVFNTVAVIEPALRGEVVLADIIGLAALMVKASSVYELLRKEPRWFVGRLPGDFSLNKKTEDILKEGMAQRDKSFDECSHPRAIRKLVHHLFPLVARADDEFTMEHVLDVDGHIAAPARLLVALQLHISGADVSLVAARRYLMHPAQRNQLASSLTPQNCMEFLECLGDVVESTAAVGVGDVESLCLDIARLADTEPFPTRSQDRFDFFMLQAENVAVRAIELVVKTTRTDRSAVAERIVVEPGGLTVAMRLFADSYLYDKSDGDSLRCTPRAKTRLTDKLAKNILEAAKSGRLLATCNPGLLLWGLSRAASHECPRVLAAMKEADPSLDGFALAILQHSFDSTKGQRYSLPDDRSRIEAYCSLKNLKAHASKRLKDPSTELPARAAWQAVVEEKSVYGVDGSYARG